MNMQFNRKLPIPMDIKEQYPIKKEFESVRDQRRKEIKDVFTGVSDRFILVIGPCSAESTEPIYEYLSRLQIVADKVKEKILIIPRIYTNKPRTSGDCYKGMLHKPDIFGETDILGGIISIRKMLISALEDYGFTCADELLYPDSHRYFSDLLAYAAVGARSVENQQHRLTASGLDIPVGMKNPTYGSLQVMLDAIVTAQHSHTFIYRGWEVVSSGNKLAHAVLRGYIDKSGKCYPNYQYDDLKVLLEMYNKCSASNPSVIIDTNHANSSKNYLKQIEIAEDVMKSIKSDKDIRRFVKGLMIESYLTDGTGSIYNHDFGQSITDPCLGWEKTEKLVFDIADSL